MHSNHRMKTNILCFFLLFALCLIAPIFSARAQVNVTNEIIAADTTLVWEALSYTPPFYKGKALMPDGGDVKILAFPPLHLGTPYELSYTWKVAGTVIPEASGPGRSFFIHRSDMFGGSPLIVVEVSKNGQRVSAGALRVPIVKPRALLYPSLPLAGVLFGREQHTASDEAMLEAYPLFFSVKSKADPALTYAWKIDNTPVRNPLGNSGRLILRRQNEGVTSVGLSIHNEDHILEAADATITMQFE